MYDKRWYATLTHLLIQHRNTELSLEIVTPIVFSNRRQRVYWTISTTDGVQASVLSSIPTEPSSTRNPTYYSSQRCRAIASGWKNKLLQGRLFIFLFEVLAFHSRGRLPQCRSFYIGQRMYNPLHLNHSQSLCQQNREKLFLLLLRNHSKEFNNGGA